MEINSIAVSSRILQEHDVEFINGQLRTITTCADEGDTVTYNKADGTIVFHIEKKTGLGLDGKDLPAEDITIYTQHIITLQQRTRVVEPITAEQRAILYETIKQFSNPVSTSNTND